MIYIYPKEDSIEKENHIRSIQNILINTLKAKLAEVPDAKIILTGHSLGGALASLAAETIGQLSEYSSRKNLHLYTFASPRVGNTDFKKRVEEKCSSCYRVFNTEDLVPQVPFLCEDFVEGKEMKIATEDIEEISYVNRKIEEIENIVNEIENNYSNSNLSSIIDESIDTYSFPYFIKPEYIGFGLLVFTTLTKIWLSCRKEEYVHIGTPICFTRYEKAISSNHNLFYTYRNTLIDEFL